MISSDVNAQKKHKAFLKRNRDKGPSLATRQKRNKIKRQQADELARVKFQQTPSLLLWIPDAKAIARKKKMLQAKFLAPFLKLGRRARRRFKG